jgi:hypothetical protein
MILEGGTQTVVVKFSALALIGEINVNQGINQRPRCEWET